ncbi:major facilitator superfamily permease [Lactobacillus hamsteri DSM 5661 = JCM 6256]|uniref:Major facilitator superfamily permease n=2 Tax=Lactobacillus hamsteri TaxID=96565 RepID=A0A0R1Y6R9_9LACO|nr:major facilitator superfamily permease [Lactobacillus hamsteri DSM 5661 = JCM 6256]
MIGFGLIVNTIGLFFGPISNEFHVGRANVALMTTFQNAAAAITLLFAGKIMEKVNLRWLLTGCFSLIAISMLSLSVAHSLIHFYIAWIIIGICQPIAITLSIPVLLSKWFNEKLGTVMGISLGLSAFGGTIFNPIIAEIINKTGWRGGFIGEGLILGLILIPLAISIKPKPDDKHPAFGKAISDDSEKILSGMTLKNALHTPVFYALAFAMLALQFVSGSVQHISGHITNIGISPIVAATVVSGVMIGAAVGKISIGYMLDKFNARLVLFIYSILGIIGWSGLVVLRDSKLLIASAFVLGLGQGVCLVALPYLIRQEFGEKDYSNILSVINMLGAFAMSASVYLVGLFFDQTGSYNMGWIINAVAYALSFIAMMMTLKKKNAK